MSLYAFDSQWALSMVLLGIACTFDPSPKPTAPENQDGEPRYKSQLSLARSVGFKLEGIDPDQLDEQGRTRLLAELEATAASASPRNPSPPGPSAGAPTAPAHAAFSMTRGCIVLQTRFWALDAARAGQGGNPGDPAQGLDPQDVVGMLPEELQSQVRGVTLAGSARSLYPDVPCLLSMETAALACGQASVSARVRLSYQRPLADLRDTWRPLCGLQTTYERLEPSEYTYEPADPRPEEARELPPGAAVFELQLVCPSPGRIPQILHVALERATGGAPGPSSSSLAAALGGASAAGSDDPAAPSRPRVTNSVLAALLPPQVLPEVAARSGLLWDVTALLDIAGTPAKRGQTEVAEYLKVCEAVRAFAVRVGLLNTAMWVQYWLVPEIRRSCGGAGASSDLERARLDAIRRFREGRSSAEHRSSSGPPAPSDPWTTPLTALVIALDLALCAVTVSEAGAAQGLALTLAITTGAAALVAALVWRAAGAAPGGAAPSLTAIFNTVLLLHSGLALPPLLASLCSKPAALLTAALPLLLSTLAPAMFSAQTLLGFGAAPAVAAVLVHVGLAGTTHLVTPSCKARGWFSPSLLSSLALASILLSSLFFAWRSTRRPAAARAKRRPQ